MENLKNYDENRIKIAMEMVDLIKVTTKMKERADEVTKITFTLKAREPMRAMLEMMMRGPDYVEKDNGKADLEKAISFRKLVENKTEEEIKEEIMDELLAEILLLQKDITINQEKLSDLNWQL